MTGKEIWWEKTVEYKFVLDAAKESGLDFAAPLSGIQEMAGDGIFSADAKLILVEFKRDFNSLKSEVDKFTCYDKAAKKLKGRDNHHFLVYGYVEKKELKLQARNYFAVKKIHPPLSILNKGLADSEFKEYLKDLITLKKVDKRSSSGTVAPEFLNTVIGLSSDGASSIPLTEYVRKALPELYQALVKTKKISSSYTNG